MRLSLALSLALTACGPNVALDELKSYSVFFEGEQTATGQVKGMVGFLDLTLSRSVRGHSQCRSLVGIRAILGSGQPLARTQGDCAPGEFEDRFVIPDGTTSDINIILDDGERTSRVVLPEALRPLQIQNDGVFLVADKNAPIDLGLRRGEYVYELTAGFTDESGRQRWRTTLEDFRGSILAGPGEAPLRGQLVLSGLVSRRAPVCRDFASCESETRFWLSVPARY